MANAEIATMAADEIAPLRKFLGRQEIEDCLARIASGADLFDRDPCLWACRADAQIDVGGQARRTAGSLKGGRAMHAEGIGTMLPMELGPLVVIDAPKHRFSASRDRADSSYLSPLSS